MQAIVLYQICDIYNNLLIFLYFYSHIDLLLFPMLSLIRSWVYLNATNEKWKNWRMYDYAVKELPALLSENFDQQDISRASIFGHSMGGHGALIIYLKNLDKYKVLSFIGKTSI
jgi:pimeloyl-ACP methyl ester carboxylesterase